jgi:hypothetical protein
MPPEYGDARKPTIPVAAVTDVQTFLTAIGMIVPSGRYTVVTLPRDVVILQRPA